MATTLVVGDILQMISVCYKAPQATELVFHAQITAIAGGAPTDQDAATVQDLAMAPLLKACMSTQAAYRGQVVRIINRVPPVPPVTANGHAGAGNDIGVMMPPQVRGLISFKTASAGRAFRGRGFIAMPSVNFAALDGSCTAGYLVNLTAILSYWNQGVITLINGGNSVNIQPGIYHARAPKPPAVVPPKGTLTPIVFGGRVNPDFATQRKSGYLGRQNNPPV